MWRRRRQMQMFPWSRNDDASRADGQRTSRRIEGAYRFGERRHAAGDCGCGDHHLAAISDRGRRHSMFVVKEAIVYALLYSFVSPND